MQVHAAAPTQALRDAVDADVRARAGVGAADKLSVLMLTFLNMGGALTSVSFSADASQVAGAKALPALRSLIAWQPFLPPSNRSSCRR